MLDIYNWNPSSAKDFTSNNLPTIGKSILSRGHVGHQSIAVTVYEDSYNLKKLDKQFPGLFFEKAMPLYDTVTIKDDNNEPSYRRGRLLQGLIAVHSFWPSQKIGPKRFFQNFFKVGPKIEGAYSTIANDMLAESKVDVSIQHYPTHSKSGKLEPSLRRKKIAELEMMHEESIKDYDKLNIEIRDINQTLIELKEKFPDIQFEDKLQNENFSEALKGIIKKLPSKDKNVAQGKIVGKGLLFDRDAAFFSQSINYEKLNHEVDNLQKEEKITHADYSAILVASKSDVDEKVKLLIDEYLSLIADLQLLEGKQDSYSEAQKSIIDMRLAIMRSQIVQEIANNVNIKEDLKQSIIQLDGKLNTQSQQVFKLTQGIEACSSLKLRLNAIQDAKNNLKIKKHKLIAEIGKLNFEITQYEETHGKPADLVMSLPTSESGKRYYIDELAILAYMEKNQNQQYNLFSNNCATSIKNCILSVIKESSPEIRDEILKLPGVSNKFFDKKFLDTPGKVFDWLCKFSKYLNQINENYEQQLTMRLAVGI